MDEINFYAYVGKEIIMTKEQLDNLIVKRAKNQFSRDVYRLGVIMAGNYGRLSVDDMKIMLNRDLCEKPRLIDKLFGGLKREELTEVDDDKYYLMQLAFRFMDIKLRNELTLSDLEPKCLGEIYYKYFKKEYEDYERHQYQLRDVELEARVRKAVAESIGASIPIGNEMT